jgi:PKD repeat protein
MKKVRKQTTTISTILCSVIIFCVVTMSILPDSIATRRNGDTLDQYNNPSLTNFSIIALPDTQKYTAYYPWIFTNQTQWIVENREVLNIVWVGHEGDITDGGTELEFQRASTSMSLLEDANTTGLPYGIPYTIIPGNHDHDIYHTNNYFNLYFNYTRFEGRPYYGGHYSTNNDNNYALFNASGMDFIVVGIDVWPDMDEIAWANNVLETHPNRRAIVISHDVLDHHGDWSPSGYWIYNLLKHNENLFLILCGHCRFYEGEARRTDVFNGHTVHTILANYQSYPYGGNGNLRIMTFYPAMNQIYVQTYSSYTNEYEFDDSSQFNLTYFMASPSPITCYAGGPYNGEIDQPIKFTGVAYGGVQPYTWYWTFGDGGSSNDQNPYHTYTKTGMYNVTLTVTDANSTVATATTTATITKPPEEPEIVIDAITGGFGIKTVITNIGRADALNLQWTIDLQGGLIFFGTPLSGTIDVLAHSSVTVKTFVFGFGTTTITMTAANATKTETAKVFLFFVNK